jgi:ubiquinone/menaquinone biosynthesis C-methylase UbiE
MNEILEREEAFHDEWAASVNIDSILVDESFESCTTPEGRQIKKWLGDLKGKTLLDLGCGLGEGAVYFAKQGAKVTAADLSSEMLEVVLRLATLHNVKLQTHKCTADSTLFPDNSFDVVYSGNLLHHVDVASTLKEVRRILKPGGVAVFCDPLVHNPLIQVYRRIAQDVRTEDEHPLSMSQLNLFRNEFRLVKYECFWFFTLWIFLRFLLIERVNPNKERYWKKIITEHSRLEPIYTPLEKWDKSFLKLMPFFKRYCWNIAIYCTK